MLWWQNLTVKTLMKFPFLSSHYYVGKRNCWGSVLQYAAQSKDTVPCSLFHILLFFISLRRRKKKKVCYFETSWSSTSFIFSVWILNDVIQTTGYFSCCRTFFRRKTWWISKSWRVLALGGITMKVNFCCFLISVTK